MAFKIKLLSAKQVRNTIAHELGHAVYGELFDGDVKAHSISFGGKTSDGWCNFYARKKKFKTTFKGESYLGGPFGEMLYCGRFAPWGSSSDIEGFVADNVKKVTTSQHWHPLLDELDNWLWVDNDKRSFRAASGVRLNRRSLFLDCQDVKERLPEFWSKYIMFLASIDIIEFNNIVEEIYKYGKKNIPEKKLNYYIKRIVKKK